MNKKNIKLFKTSFAAWIPLAVAITILCGLIYVAVQQSLRQSANDPQIQLVEDIASQLAAGQNPLYFVPPGKIDVSKSLATYILVFDGNGKLIDSSVTVNGKSPSFPQGVFPQTKAKGETRFTWQPVAGIRSAIVMDYYRGSHPGFVAVGRSIKEIEIRENSELQIIVLGWVVAMLASYASLFFVQKFK